RRDLQLAEGIEQGRQTAPLSLRQGPVARDELFDKMPFAVIADRQTVARPQLGVHQVELGLQLENGAVEIACLVALPLLFGADVEDGAMHSPEGRLDVEQHGLDAIALVDKGLVQAGKGLLLSVLQRFELGEGEALEEFRIFLDLAAEEEAGGDD